MKKIFAFKLQFLNFFQPILIGIFPAIYLLRANLGEALISEFFVALVALFLVSCTAIFVFSVVLRSTIKGCLFASLVLLFLFYFIPFSSLFWGTKIIRTRYLLVLAIFSLAVVFIRLFKSQNQKYFFSKFFILPLLGLIGYSLLDIGIFKIRLYRIISNYERGNNLLQKKSQRLDDFGEAVRGDVKKKKPNIFFIILDRYVSYQTLLNHFNYNNRPFLAQLKGRGFELIEKSHSNYHDTRTSLPSSLNMNYLPNNLPSEERLFCGFMKYLIRNNNVARFVKGLGYKYFNVASMWENTFDSELADQNYRYSFMADFCEVLMRYTLFYFLWRPFREDYARKWIHFQLKTIKDLSLQQGPFFVFAHIICPHPPFLFDEKGKEVSHGSCDDETAYVKQLQFINKKITEVIDVILKNSSEPPIIVLQGDHGTGYDAFDKGSRVLNYDLEHVPSQSFRECFGILNAFYLPDNKKRFMYDSFSPVNNFRFIFNQFFGANFPLFDDKSYLGPNDQGKFIQVDHLMRKTETKL